MEVPPRLSVRKLVYFLRVAEAGGMRPAAASLNVSQPALGMQIKELENSLGVRLFERHNKGIVLTPAGSTFLPHAREAVEAIQRAERSVGLMQRPNAPVRLGVTPSIGRVAALQLLSMGQTEDAELTFLLHENVGSELVKLLQAGELDGTLCSQVPSGMEAFPMFEEDLFLIGRPEVIGKIATPVMIDRLATLPLVMGGMRHASRLCLDQVAAKAGFKPNIQIEMDSLVVQRELILHRDVCTVAPRGLLLTDILSGELACLPFRPAIRQVVKLGIPLSCSASRAKAIQNAILTSMRRCDMLGAVGWRLIA
jgi:LysR family nitrogen assimilation transcriptional regulator